MPHAEPSKGKSRTALATAPRCLHIWSSQQWLRSGTGSTHAPAAPDPNTHTGTQTITAGFVISPVTDRETPHAVAHSVPSVSALRHARPPRTQAAVSEQPILTMKVHNLDLYGSEPREKVSSCVPQSTTRSGTKNSRGRDTVSAVTPARSRRRAPCLGPSTASGHRLSRWK